MSVDPKRDSQPRPVVSEREMVHWLTTREAAAYLRARGPSSVRNWVTRGLLIPDGRVGTGGTWLFTVSTLIQFARRCARGAFVEAAESKWCDATSEGAPSGGDGLGLESRPTARGRNQ
jgi:hypothetical protein